MLREAAPLAAEPDSESDQGWPVRAFERQSIATSFDWVNEQRSKRIRIAQSIWQEQSGRLIIHLRNGAWFCVVCRMKCVIQTAELQ